MPRCHHRVWPQKKKHAGPWLSRYQTAYRSLTTTQVRHQCRRFLLRINGNAYARNGMVDALKAVRLDDKHRKAEFLDGANKVLIAEVPDGQYQVRLQGHKFLQRRVDHTTHAGFLPCFRRILGEVGNSGDVVTPSQGVNRVSDAGRQTNQAVRMIGDSHFAVKLVLNSAAAKRSQTQAHCDGSRLQCPVHRATLHFSRAERAMATNRAASEGDAA